VGGTLADGTLGGGSGGVAPGGNRPMRGKFGGGASRRHSLARVDLDGAHISGEDSRRQG